MVSREEFNNFLTMLYNKEENKHYQISPKDVKKYNNSVSVFKALFCLIPFVAIAAVCLLIFVSKANLLIAITLPCFLAFFLCVIIYIIYAFTIGSLTKELNKFFYNNKDLIINFLLNDSGYSFKYTPYKFIDKETFKKAKVSYSTQIDKYKGEDLLDFYLNVGKNKSLCKFSLSDVFAEHRVEVKNDDGTIETRYETIYKGLFGEMTLPKAALVKLAINNNNHFKYKELHSIKFEDIKFNQMYSVKTNSDLESFYFITPTMIENLKAIRKHFRNFGLIIDENKIYITSPYKNLFSLKIDKNFDLYSIYESVYNDVLTIISIITEIINNEKLYEI